MIKASSLFYAIVISLIIAIVSSSLILFAYLSRIQFENFEINERLNLNADSGLKLLLSRQSLVEINQEKQIDLYGQGTDNVELTRKFWGAYEIIISKTVFKNKAVQRIAQVGFYLDSFHSYSLYLADQDKPLALCGNTKIKGKVFLPKAGVKRAYIEGQSFTGMNLIDGEIKQSEKALPAINKKMVEGIQQILSTKSISMNDSLIKINNEISGDSIINSFNNKSVILSSSNQIKISNGIYSGNLVVISDKQIFISSTAFMKDAIIYAPKVFIEKGFHGNIQIFASDSIILDKNVTLTYPSVLGIIRADSSSNVASIVLNENDTISGNIFAYKKETEILKQVGVLIKEKAIVNGQVYSNGYVDVRGTINGSVMCNKIMLSTPSSVYENHLLNATIDLTKLSSYFVGINLVEESSAKRIVKWLN